MRKLFTFILAAVCGLCAMAQNTHNGHEYVDLGLGSGICWATCNVGADSPEAYGDYYAWGETMTKVSYTWGNYTFGNESNQTKYNATDQLEQLEAQDDAATSNWGGKWRMPTTAEWSELIENCTWQWESEKNGYKVIGSNGNYIFLPAAGYKDDKNTGVDGTHGYYWTSSTGGYAPYYASGFAFTHNSVERNLDDHRKFGQSVRPVCKKSDIPTTITHATIEGLRTESGRVVCSEEFRIYSLSGADVTSQNGTLKGLYIVKTVTAAQKVAL